MPTPFTRSMRSLAIDSFRPTIMAVLATIVMLGIWLTWFFTADITIYEVSNNAHLEASNTVHPIESIVNGRIDAVYVQLNHTVKVGDLLFEYDAEEKRLELNETQAKLAASASQLHVAQKEIALAEQLLREIQDVSSLAVDEAVANHQKAQAAAKYSKEQAERSRNLHETGLISEADLQKAVSTAEQDQASAEALRVTVNRVTLDQQSNRSRQQNEIESLQRERARLEGEIKTIAVSIQRLEHEMERRRVRATIAGTIGEMSGLQVGSVVSEGDRLGVIIPFGGMKIVADFQPASALGRIHAGQRARARLQGFPWTQYGMLDATVAGVASEVQNGQVRVELVVQPGAASSIPMQHGLPAAVEIAVDAISPAALVLRSVGKQIGVAKKN